MRYFQRLIISCLFILHLIPLRADEGMWLPILLAQLNEVEMQSMGMEITAEDIYSINKSSMKDAVMLFGTGCTGSLISSNGLLLTNHHCGLGVIQSHSKVGKDYIKNGFWASNSETELVNKTLTVTFLIRMEDVTQKVLENIPDNANEGQRTAIIQQNIDSIRHKATEGTHYDSEVKSFYAGNEYYLFVTEKYLDVRLVGAPPASIGKFGGDTDNWEWPRHTGDFSLFRVYTAPDGSPAAYSPENIPLKSKYYFPISTKGIQKGDFTMVMGFPYRTQEYLSSYGVELVEEVEHPTKVALRDIRLSIIEAEMAKSDKVRIQYTSKQSSIANGYKKWKGALKGLKKAEAVERKREEEEAFKKLVASKPEWNEAYGNLLSDMEKAYTKYTPLLKSNIYFQEAAYAPEIIGFANNLGELVGLIREGSSADEVEAYRESLKKKSASFYKNYHPPIDQQIMTKMLEEYGRHTSQLIQPDIFQTIHKKYKGDFEAYTQNVFEETALRDETTFNTWIATADDKEISQDPAYELMLSLVIHYYNVISPNYEQLKKQIDELNRQYMQAQRTVFQGRTFYPDANFSMRVTYGKVEGYQPKDGIRYNYYTTLDGAINKRINNPQNTDYELPEKLMKLHLSEDYGRYDEDGELRTAFISSMHTTGGNSGSPVMNGKGHIIGLYFDRNWEGAMSDIYYDPNQVRSICVDIRYVLFIIDKYANAGYLLDEMRIVEG